MGEKKSSPKKLPLDQAPERTLLHRRDGFDKRIGNVKVCHWCRGVLVPSSVWVVQWFDMVTTEGVTAFRRRASDLCADCMKVLHTCDSCVAYSGDGRCWHGPPAAGGEDRFVGAKDRCLNWEQDHLYGREELEAILAAPGLARIE